MNVLHRTKKQEKTRKLEAKDVLPNKPHTGRQKSQEMLFFVHGDLDL